MRVVKWPVENLTLAAPDKRTDFRVILAVRVDRIMKPVVMPNYKRKTSGACKTEWKVDWPAYIDFLPSLLVGAIEGG